MSFDAKWFMYTCILGEIVYIACVHEVPLYSIIYETIHKESHACIYNWNINL